MNGWDLSHSKNIIWGLYNARLNWETKSSGFNRTISKASFFTAKLHKSSHLSSNFFKSVFTLHRDTLIVTCLVPRRLGMKSSTCLRISFRFISLSTQEMRIDSFLDFSSLRCFSYSFWQVGRQVFWIEFCFWNSFLHIQQKYCFTFILFLVR